MGETEDSGGGDKSFLESAVLGVIHWWLNRNSRGEVLVLISRHFRSEEVLHANQLLAQACQLPEPISHRNSQLRTAGEANATDLLDNLDILDSEKRAPRYLVPSDDLGKIPLSALSIRDEVSVSARLENLEEGMKKIYSVLDRAQTNVTPTISARVEKLEKSLRPSEPSFAAVVGAQHRSEPSVVVTGPPQQAGGPHQVPHEAVHDVTRLHTPGAGALGTGVGTRVRTRSTSQKRKADEEKSDDDGFRRQGRQRQRTTASGTSQVQVDGVGEYIAPVEFYVGNTDKRTNEETIMKVLKKCAAGVEGGEDLVIEKVELLTKEQEPRTKCWKIVVPFRFKSLMERDDVYPGGWKHRTFYNSRNSKDKKPRLDQGDSIEQQVLQEQERETARQLQLQKETALNTRLQQLESRMTNPTAGGPGVTA